MISTKGRYALRAMVDLAEHLDDQYTSLKEIALRQNISEKYLEAILKILVQNDLLYSRRGKSGGYKLTRSPQDYTVGEILELEEGTLAVVSCLDNCDLPCQRNNECKTLQLWKEFDAVTRDFLFNKTLADLVE